MNSSKQARPLLVIICLVSLSVIFVYIRISDVSYYYARDIQQQNDVRTIIVLNSSNVSTRSRHPENIITKSQSGTAISKIEDSKYLVNTPFCKILNADPFDPSVIPFLHKVDPLACTVQYDIVYSRENKVFINWTEVDNSPYKEILQYCRYDVIWRPPNKPNSNYFYKYLKVPVNFYSFVQINHEYIRVQCFSRNESVLYTNFFSFVQNFVAKDDEADNKISQHCKSVDEILSVLMIGVDSISRLNMIRYMNQTRLVLSSQMGAIELQGYNKVGENTFHNIGGPMLSGQFTKDLSYNSSDDHATFDQFNFIWGDFQRAGYKTLYSEDEPDLAIYDYYKNGFKYIPTDVYNRHFTVAMEDTKDVWNTKRLCVHARPEVSIHLDQLRQFINVFKHKPYFAFNFNTKITHDYLENVQMVDKIYSDFLTSLTETDVLNNTVLFFFSDHGLRFGDFLKTSLGKLEERLPFMYLLFPKWFLRKYPKIKRNLDTNAIRLTTPFDVYATLTKILNFKADDNDVSYLKRGRSLLSEIDYNRTCEDADVTPQWCTCYQLETVNVSRKAIVKLAKYLTIYINEIQAEVATACEHLDLAEVMSASKLHSGSNHVSKQSKKPKLFTEYRLTIKTFPGFAIFEGTLRVSLAEKRIDVLGDISRLNMYGNQSHCINEASLKRFCFCKEQL